MKRDLLTLVATLLIIGCNFAGTKTDCDNSSSEITIFVNQEGYLPSSEKYFIVNHKYSNFEIKNSSDDSIVFTGDIELRSELDRSTGETIYIGDFSGLKTHGEFYVELKDGLKSFNFKISTDLFNSVRDKGLKSFYYQRASIELESKHAGKFARAAGHLEPLEYHSSSALLTPGQNINKDVSGGWYDAGDFGRYIIPGSVSLGVMLMGYDQYPQKFESDSTNIPESGNSIPDFLDEMKYELDWMLKMQNIEVGKFKGALPYMVNSPGYAWGMPASTSEKQYIYDFSSVATADFAAIMAFSYRIYKDFELNFANRCLNAAKLAWKFLEDNSGPYPENGFKRPSDTVTGGYAQSGSDNKVDIDDRLWAAVELFLSTEDEVYHLYFKQNRSKNESGWNVAWNSLPGFSKVQYLMGDSSLTDSAIVAELKTELLSYADRLLNTVKSDGFKTALSFNDYFWGSNGEILNRAQYLIIAHQLTSDTKYYNGALSQLNYILGLNVNNMSYVVGTGDIAPTQIHHAIYQAKTSVGNFPGLMAGGANSRLSGDYTLPKYFDSKTPPAKCYIDHVDSWASNENCILYNAPLVPVAGYFSK